MPDVFTIKIVGPAGSGIFSAGEAIFRGLVKSGYYCLGYPEYPSLIKGGHNTYSIIISSQKDPVPNNNFDLLVCLNQNSFDQEHQAIGPDTVVVTDKSIKTETRPTQIFQPDLISVSKQIGNPLLLNTCFLGFLSHQLKLDDQVLLDQVLGGLSGKSETLLEQNRQAYKQSLALSQKYYLEIKLPKKSNQDQKLVLTGNQAVGLGAIAAGINLYAAYPMTPSSSLLHFLSDNQEKYNYLVRQTEDEIAAINTAIGASFAGAKAMTGTSGGGFALMQEGVSLAGALELPLVIFLAQRPGPATGLPTWTSQGDLLFTVFSGAGEFPKLVLAPSDCTDAYLLTHRAFQVSQQFHIPVIILSDKYLAENLYCLSDLPELDPVQISFALPNNPADSFYPRYQFSQDGIHDRTLPGMDNGFYIANSDEHDQSGLVDESLENREMQNQRRQNKASALKKIIPQPLIYGPESTTLLISWGSNKAICDQVAQKLAIRRMHFQFVWPFPDGLKEALQNFQKIIVYENNLTHQFARLLTSETAVSITKMLGQDSGRPISPDQLIALINHES